MSKKVNKLTEPNMRLYFLLAAVFCAVTLWIEPILGLVEAGVMALTYVYFRRTAQKRREGIQRYVEDMTDDVASAGKSSMLSAPFAMMVFRPDTQEVLWSNESFLQLTGMRENLFDNRLEDTLRECAGDDFTLLGVIFGYGEFSAMQRRFRPRLEWLRKTYIEPLETAAPAEINAMWLNYSRSYYA